MYSKATYVKPYIRKFIRVLGINNVGTLNKPKMNVIYAILANNGIKPIDKNQYGVPLYQYRDLDGLNDLSIIAGFHKWKDDMLRKDVEISMRDNDKVKKYPGYRVAKKQPDTQTQIQFDDENDDRLYESLFNKKVYFTNEQIEHVKASLISTPSKKIIYLTQQQVQTLKEKLENKNNEENDKYIENDYGEKWERQNTNTKIFKQIKDKLNFKNKSNLALMDVAKVSGESHYIVMVDGGLNGNGKWQDYLDDFKQIIIHLPNSWIIDLDVDVLDDVWTLTLGTEPEKINEGVWGVEPDKSDTYLDFSHELCEPIIKILSEKLPKYVNTPKNNDGNNDGNIYYWLGLMLGMLKVKAFNESWFYSADDSGRKDNKYKQIRELFKCANKGFDYLLTDNAKDNRQGWQNFNEYKNYLEKMYDEFKKLEDYYNMDKEKPKGADKLIRENANYVDTNKVLLMKKYLDDNFVRASMPIIGNDGYPKNVQIVGMKGADGEIARNMTAKQLFYLLQDKFKGIYGDKAKRNALIKQTMIDWYNKKISNEGLLSKNTY